MKQTFIIAEAGVNHNGSIELAQQLVDAACEAGADAVKFQTFKAENLVTHFAPKAEYQDKNFNTCTSQLEMLQDLELSLQDHQVLKEYCQEKKIEFLSTPFDIPSIQLIKSLEVKFIKISSADVTNAPLLLEAAKTGLPIILSTGMSDLKEIEMALSVISFAFLNPHSQPSLKAFEESYKSEDGKRILKEKVTLLHCTSEYPAPFCDIHLRAMQLLQSEFGLPFGISDHSLGVSVAIAAVALGAKMVEKHFTLSKNFKGPDHAASLEPSELKNLVESIRQIELALGEKRKIVTPSETNNKQVIRRSLVASKAIKKGEHFTEENLMAKRPGTGLSPFHYWEYLGKEAERDYEKDEMI